jgi:membrane-bound lytic murein transglycosylase A
MVGMTAGLRLMAFGALVILGGCAERERVQLAPTSYKNLPGWESDRHAEALPALKNTCRVIQRKSDDTEMLTRADGLGYAADWKPVCQKLETSNLKHHADVRRFMETHMMPYQVLSSKGTKGTFTGYYIPVLKGSRTRHGRYQTPLYKLPTEGTAHRIPRSEIVRGALKGKGLELIYVDDPVDAFQVQIEGTGKVHLDSGEVIRINYAGQNGYPFSSTEAAMIKQGVFKTKNVSTQMVHKWLREHPKQAERYMSINQSYVFFEEEPWAGDAIGAHSVPLIPHRSMAVDRSYITLGTPLWLAASHPVKGKLQQLMVAQDVGGAIKGPIRGDYYWGVGEQAAHHAGIMNTKGELFVLLPKG